MRRSRATKGALTVGLALLPACGDAIPRPAYATTPEIARIEVPYPPPPARAEFVPASPRADAVWLDGEWIWEQGTWSWVYGRWVVPPTGSVYAPAGLARRRDATLLLAPGVWRDAAGRIVAEPRPLVTGRASEEDVVVETGQTDDNGENVPPPPPPVR